MPGFKIGTTHNKNLKKQNISILWSMGISQSDASLSLLRKQLPVHMCIYVRIYMNATDYILKKKLTFNCRTHFKYANYTQILLLLVLNRQRSPNNKARESLAGHH